MKTLLILAALALLAGCTHIPPGSAGEVHSSTSYLGVVSTSTDLTDFKVTDKKIVAGSASFHTNILGFSHTTTAKDLIMTNPEDAKK